MSRTYRRRKTRPPRWVVSELVRVTGTWYWEYVPLEPNSTEYKKSLAKYQSDAFSNHKEPGPAWFRNLFTERPQRREATRQIRKYMMDPDFEIQLLDKNPLMYWT